MELGVIKTDEQHRRYLEEARRFAKGDPGRPRVARADELAAAPSGCD